MAEKCVGVIGATSLVGEPLLGRLEQGSWQVIAYSRRSIPSSNGGPTWRRISPSPDQSLPAEAHPDCWICVAPIWILPQYFSFFEAGHAKKIVALSSTSRFTKTNSSDREEQETARRLADAERSLRQWAEQRGISWVILRPTLIYGAGKDKNISEIVRFIRRFGFFPLFGKAAGLRQPVHADDVAQACAAALSSPDAVNRAFNLSGGETLSYREMACRVFSAMGRRPRLLTVPLSAFRIAVRCLHVFPRYRHWSAAMAERMNQDLVFDHEEATRCLGFRPRAFGLTDKDMPV